MAAKAEKLSYLRSAMDGVHRWSGATYEVHGGKYRQIYAPGHPVTGWRTLGGRRRKRSSNPVLASYRSSREAGAAKKKLIAGGVKAPEVMKAADGNFWLWVWDTELDRAQKILGIERSASPGTGNNPRRRKNSKWSAGWYWLEFAEGKPERQKVWLGPRQAGSLSKHMVYQGRHVREMTHDYEDKRGKPARSMAGQIWQRELGINRRKMSRGKRKRKNPIVKSGRWKGRYYDRLGIIGPFGIRIPTKKMYKAQAKRRKKKNPYLVKGFKYPTAKREERVFKTLASARRYMRPLETTYGKHAIALYKISDGQYRRWKGD